MPETRALRPVPANATFYRVAIGARAGVCNGPNCGARIFWIVSPRSGRPMPISCDVEGGKEPTEQRDPRQVDLFTQKAEQNHFGRGVSHFIVCPDADSFSKRGGR